MDSSVGVTDKRMPALRRPTKNVLRQCCLNTGNKPRRQRQQNSAAMATAPPPGKAQPTAPRVAEQNEDRMAASEEVEHPA
jgi:hypothetical protein